MSFAIPVRNRLVFVTFTLATLLYVDRIAISAAKEPITAEFAMSDTQFGWVLSAFALGYALFQAPSGYLADRFGPRAVMASIVILWSVFTGLTGLAMGLASLLIYRFLFGLAEAGAFPTTARALYMWLPASERGLAQGINLSGSRLGAAFALPGIAWMLTVAGWRTSFIILGVIGVVWAAAWYLWFRNDPKDHPAVSADELSHIVKGRGAAKGPEEAPPVGMMWRSPNLLLAMGQYFASNFTFFFCLTWLFPYLQRTYQLDIMHTAVLSALPLLGGAVGNWLGGWLVDHSYRSGHVNQSRRYVGVAGFTLAVIGLGGGMFADSALVAVLFLTVAMLGADMTLPPSWAFCIDIGGKYSGSVSGMMNMAGNLGSFITSLAFPYLLLLSGSTMPFFVTGMVLNVLGIICWLKIRPELGLTRSSA